MKNEKINLKREYSDRIKIATQHIGVVHNILKPCGVGDFSIVHKEVTNADCLLEKERATVNLNFGEVYPIYPGTYTYLLDAGEQVMSDTPTEILTNINFLKNAYGNILIGGLGLGIIPSILMSYKHINRLTIVEKNYEVIAMVMSQLAFPLTVEVIESDIFDFKPNLIYDSIYFDIWTDLGMEEFNQMEYLQNKFKNYLIPGGFIESWRQEL